ncbi:MAG: hypothetical protein R3F56_12700 [Planctomycetota bacterium]
MNMARPDRTHADARDSETRAAPSATTFLPLLRLISAVLCLATLALAAWQVRHGAGLPFEDWALDSDSATTGGEIVALTPLADRTDVVRVTFRYRNQGIDYEQNCHVPSDHGLTGLQHTVELLARDPAVSRVRGTQRAVPPTVSWNLMVVAGGLGIALAMLAMRFRIAQRQQQAALSEPAHGTG